MRIAIVGNMDNNGYRLCRWMRDCGEDASLFWFELDSSPRSDPSAVDRAIKSDGLPAWMRRYEGFRPVKLRWLLRPQRGARVIESEYDIALTSGYTGILAAYWLRHIPFVHLSIGDEVTTLPRLLWKPGVRADGLYGRVASWAARRALARASTIFDAYGPSMQTLSSLGLASKIRVAGWPEDVVGNLQRVDKALLANLEMRYARYDRVLLWLSRLNYADARSPEYKGPEQFLEAFRRLVQCDHAKVRAVVGTHGADADSFRALVRSLRLETAIDFVPHLPYWKLLTYLRVRNAIALDTIHPERGASSGMTREALSVGAVVVRSVDKALIRLCYGAGYPVVAVSNADECYLELLRLIRMEAGQFQALRAKSLAWAKAHLDYTQLTPKLIGYLYEAYYVYHVNAKKGRPDRSHPNERYPLGYDGAKQEIDLRPCPIGKSA